MSFMVPKECKKWTYLALDISEEWCEKGSRLFSEKRGRLVGREENGGGGSFLADYASKFAPIRLAFWAKQSAHRVIHPSPHRFVGAASKGLVPGTSGAPRGHRGDVGVISVISVIGRVIFVMTVFGWMDDRAWQLCLREKAEVERKEGRKSCERTSWRRKGVLTALVLVTGALLWPRISSV